MIHNLKSMHEMLSALLCKPEQELVLADSSASGSGICKGRASRLPQALAFPVPGPHIPREWE